ncbi:MAG: tail fiber domain-containing protein [Gammaproteobacteria bacterium]|nr:tail fiber domain-containing protein [Gammaproteobacteria bacterium]
MSKGPEVSTTSNEPWAEQSPHLKDMFSGAADLYNNYDPTYYGGDAVADLTTAQNLGLTGMQDWAQQGKSQVLDPALQAFQYGTGSNVLDVANNPYVTGMAQAAARDAYSALPGLFGDIRSGSVLSGGYGGGRQGIAEGNAIGTANQNAINATANIYGNAYGQGLQHQGNVLGMAGGLMDLGNYGNELLMNAGGVQQTQNQAETDALMDKHNWEQNLPYQQLQNYQNAVGGFQWGGEGTSTQPGKDYTGEVIQAIAMSDERLKENINKVGQLPSGLGIYSWDWKEGAEKLGADMKHTVGVIAQEVKKLLPDAVSKTNEGFYQVDYSKVV